jgi:hypothetical protein
MKTIPITVHRPTFSTDDYGNTYPTGSFTNRETRGWMGATRAQEITDGRQTMTVQTRVGFDGEEDVDEKDEITVNGQRYRITSVAQQYRGDRVWITTCNVERAE